ncbi:MAG: CAP domain-containing protein [Planctomycetota bacterium]
MVPCRSLCAALLLVAGPACQEAPPKPKPASSLVIQLKSRRLDLDKATAVVAELKTRPTRFRIQASTALRKQFLRRQQDYEKLASKVFDAFARAAKQAQRDLLGRDGAARVESLRAEARGVTRGPGLTKAAIKQQIDPKVKELGELLQPSFADVLRADDDLDLKLTDLRVYHTELHAWFALYASATEGLELHEDAQKHFAKLPVPAGPGEEARIDERIAAETFAGLPMSAADRKTLAANRSLRGTHPREELLGTLELNRLRYLLGLRLVRIDPKLADAARDHSKDMATLGFFSHTSPVKGKERFGQRAANFGTSASAENIAAGQRTGHGAIRAWWYSPGHHKNMLGGHGRTGLGQHGTMWTQMFGG